MQVYALAPAKAQAVALETQRIWCSLAERLGMFALKVLNQVMCCRWKACILPCLQVTECRGRMLTTVICACGVYHLI